MPESQILREGSGVNLKVPEAFGEGKAASRVESEGRDNGEGTGRQAEELVQNSISSGGVKSESKDSKGGSAEPRPRLRVALRRNRFGAKRGSSQGSGAPPPSQS